MRWRYLSVAHTPNKPPRRRNFFPIAELTGALHMLLRLGVSPNLFG